MKNIALGPWIKLVFRPWVRGLENVPTDGPAIMASNHLSFSDSVFLPLVLNRKIVFLGKSDYFTGKGIKGRLTRSEEHTSELQSRGHLVCRLLLEKKSNRHL